MRPPASRSAVSGEKTPLSHASCEGSTTKTSRCAGLAAAPAAAWASGWGKLVTPLFFSPLIASSPCQISATWFSRFVPMWRSRQL